MATVFLSYERECANKARAIAAALEKTGHRVWWDQHIQGGAEYSREIEEALKSADAVVVLWSERSVHSPWVRDEAAAGRDSGRLVPVRLDSTEPPLGFRQYQTIDLSRWNGRGKSALLTPLLDTIKSVAAGGGPADARSAGTRPAVQGSAAARTKAGVAIAAVAALLILSLAALLIWRPWSAQAAVPVVALGADNRDPGSLELARDLLIKLGTLQSARADAFRLVEKGKSEDEADLILEAGRTVRGGQVQANLALLAGEDRTVLWSKQFVRAQAEEAELRNELSVASARALDCALQAVTGERQLRSEVIKLYLNGCTVLDDLAIKELRQAIPIFLEVTRLAPRFEGGWARLLQAEVLTLITGEDSSLRQSLKEHIAQARRINPHMPVAYLAEVELLSPVAYADRMRLVDLAVRHGAGQPEPFAARAYYLADVGRLNEAVESAKRASELNPLSAALHTDYTSALADAGRLDLARAELQRAAERWPGSSVISNAWFMFNLRHGDPREALRTQVGGDRPWPPNMARAFLLARITPAAANVDAAVREALSLNRRDPASIGIAIQTLGTFDRDQEVFRLILEQPARERGRIAQYLFRPALRELRHDPRFMQLAQHLRLTDYWRTSGKWPDFCFEPDLPYDCKAEAARFAS